MSGKTDFTEDEWETIIEGPPTAGMIVVTAQRGGMFRESLAMAKAYGEARKQHGESQLLDEIVTAKPKVDHTRFQSVDELREHGLGRLREAAGLIERKAPPDELEGYRRFVLALAKKVAEAHREGDASVSEAERAAIDEIASALGPAAR